MRRRQLVGTLALSLLLASGASLFAVSAYAQTTKSGDAADVIVTAQRRKEKVQDVPITITVVTPAQLNRQNIQTTTDLVRAVPSLTTDDEGVFQVRSLGTEGYGRSAEQSVSVVLDGVVLARGLTNAMYDLDHVEVLSGPQGTLFGKNATAGVVNIVTNAPVIGQYQAIGHADVGNQDYVHSYVIANLPLGDDAALRLSYHHDSTGHIVFNTLYDKWDYNTDDGVRARLLWKPTSNLTLNLSADYQKLGSNGVNGVADFAGVAVYTYAPPGSALQQTLAACGIVASPTNNKVCANSLYAKGVNIGDTYGRWNAGGSLQVDYALPHGFTFTSITALRETTNEDFGVHADVAGEFADTLPQNILDRNLVPYYDRTWSEEARIASPASDPVNFVAGFYYSNTYTHDEIDQTGQFGIAALGPLEYRRLINIYINQDNYAGFGQVNWHATSKLKLFAGGRITHDDLSDFSFNSFPGAYPNGNYIYTGDTGFFSVLPVNSCTVAGGVPYDTIQKPCPAGTSINAPGRLSTTGLSGTVGAEYQFDRRLMVFATLSHGYKGPFLNEAATYVSTLPQTPLLVKPEYPTDVELGVKATINRFALDASLFYDYVQNFQTTIYIPPSSTQAVANFIQGNAPYAITQGVEVSLFGDLSDDFSVNAAAIYDDAHFNNGFLVSCSTGPCPALHQLPFAPREKVTLSGDYHRPIAGHIVGFLQSDLAYSGPYPYASAPGYPGSPPRYLLGARGGIRLDDGKWSLALFCRNCLDKRYPIVAAPDGYAAYDGGIVGSKYATYQFLTIDSYRVVGVTLDGRF